MTDKLTPTTDETFTSSTLADVLQGRDLPVYVLDASGHEVPATYLRYVYDPAGNLVAVVLQASR